MRQHATLPGRTPLGLRLHAFVAHLRLALARALSGDIHGQVGS